MKKLIILAIVLSGCSSEPKKMTRKDHLWRGCVNGYYKVHPPTDLKTVTDANNFCSLLLKNVED